MWSFKSGSKEGASLLKKWGTNLVLKFKGSIIHVGCYEKEKKLGWFGREFFQSFVSCDTTATNEWMYNIDHLLWVYAKNVQTHNRCVGIKLVHSLYHTANINV